MANLRYKKYSAKPSPKTVQASENGSLPDGVNERHQQCGSRMVTVSQVYATHTKTICTTAGWYSMVQYIYKPLT